MRGWRHYFEVSPRNELKEFYLFTSFFSFASALIIIFEPVFFYQQGISLARISLYYCLHYVAYLVLLPWGGKFAYKFGLERSLSLSMPLFVVYFLMLAQMPKAPELFWLAWLVLAVFKIFYWPAVHASLAKYSHRANQGTELSWLWALERGVGVMGPMMGGLVATYLGFPVLFMLAAGLALLAAWPLLKTREHFQPINFPYGKSWQMLVSQKYRRLGWGMAGWVEDLVELVYWPIFMFLVLGGADKLGFVASLNVFIMVLFGFLVGEISDQVQPRRLLKWQLPGLAASFLIRPLAATGAGVLLSDAVAKVTMIGARLPMMHRLYAQGRKDGPIRYMVLLEMQLSVAKAVAAGALGLVFTFTSVGTGLTAAFIVAALFTAFYALL